MITMEQYRDAIAKAVAMFPQTIADILGVDVSEIPIGTEGTEDSVKDLLDRTMVSADADIAAGNIPDEEIERVAGMIGGIVTGLCLEAGYPICTATIYSREGKPVEEIGEKPIGKAGL
jgi:hypothetical protein